MIKTSPQTTAVETQGAACCLPGVDIDLSCRRPLLASFLSAAVWLVVGSAFAFIASIKFHSPSFLSELAWLTYGRVLPVASTALVYGFCIQAGLGVALWIMARLGVRELVGDGFMVLGTALWNLGLLIGVLGILSGDSTGFELIELPSYAAPLLFLGYSITAFCGVLTFSLRTEKQEIYVSQWFLLAAFFWFPWIFSTAVLLLSVFPVRGVTQSVIAWWYAGNLRVVWFWLVGLAAVFYFIPRITGRELKNRYLALFTFWMLILFAGWSGIPARAPLPAWMPVLSTIGGVMTLLPLLTVFLIVFRTLDGKCCFRQGSLPLNFIGFGVLSLLVSGVMLAAASTVTIDRMLGLTWFTSARWQLNSYGFFAMALFGAIYYLTPQVTGIQFCPRLARAHFWLASTGLILAAVPLAVGGVMQGVKLQNPTVAFMDTVKPTQMFLRISTLGDLLILVGHLAFLANVAGVCWKLSRALISRRVEMATANLFDPEGAKV